MMYTYIEKSAPNTVKFLKYLVSVLLSREPLKANKTILVSISEDSPNFPEFNEFFHERERERKTEDFIQERANLAKGKATTLYYYIKDKFTDHTTIGRPLVENRTPLTCSLSFTIKDPNGLYKMAEALDIKVPNINNQIDRAKEPSAMFSENPPQINWKGGIISIPPNSKQFCVCKVAFTKIVGEVVHWDEIAQEIDGQPKEELKTNWHTVYNAVRLINQKIENKVGHKLFKSAKYSFTRIA